MDNEPECKPAGCDLRLWDLIQEIGFNSTMEMLAQTYTDLTDLPKSDLAKYL